MMLFEKGDETQTKLQAKMSQTSLLIEQAQTLLADFNKVDNNDSSMGSELVVKLQQVLNRMRTIWPPRTFSR